VRRCLIAVLVLLAVLAGGASSASAHEQGSVAVTLTATPNPVTAGATVAYDTTLANGGAKPLHGVALDAPAPAGASVVDVISAGSCTTTATLARCWFGDVAPGAAVAATVIVRLPSTPGTVSSSVTWSSGDGDHDFDDAEYTASTSVSVQAPSPDAVSEYVLPAGDTVSTGSTTSASNPQSTIVSVPSTPAGAATSLAELDASGPADACGPGATCFGQISLVTVSAPPFPAGDPLTLTFLLDRSKVPRHTRIKRIPMFHDGVAVPNCTGAPGVAAPDPCVAVRKVERSKHCKHGGGTVVIVVLSTTNGRWRP
jgi:Domain of unknown function DUF11